MEKYNGVKLHDAASATANGEAFPIINNEEGPFSTAAFQITGTFTATITFEATLGRSTTQASNTWVAIPAENVTTGAVATTATAAGVYRANVSGFSFVRARLTWTSGTSITVIAFAIEQASTTPALASASLGGVDVLSIAAGSNTIGNTRDAGPSWTSVFGVSGAVFASADASTAAAVTDAPTSGQKLVVTDIILSVGSTAMQVDFEIETAGTVFFTIHAAANTTYQITPRSKFKLPTADKKLMIDTSAAGNVAVTAFYYSEA